MRVQLNNERGGVRSRDQEPKPSNVADSTSDVNPLLRSFDEPTRIRFVREGFYFGPRAWRAVPTENQDPFDLPSGFKLDELKDEELKLIVDLGIVTVAVLTAVQRERWEKTLDLPIRNGTAASLMGKLAAGSTATT